MDFLVQRMVSQLIGWRWFWLALALVLAAGSWRLAGQLAFDRRIESMFAHSSPLLPPYARLKRTFGGNEVVLAVYEDDDLLNAQGAGLARLAQVADELAAVPGVADVLSLNRVLPLPRQPLSPLNEPVRKLFEGYTHNSSGQIAALACFLAPEEQAHTPRSETIATLRGLMQAQPGGRITGEPVMLVDGFRYVEDDGRRLAFWSTGLLALTIFACFRSLRWVLAPLAVVQFALLVTQATLVVAQVKLSMVSSMLAAIVTVVGIAAVVHVMVRFRELRTTGLTPRAALTLTGEQLASPTFWSCFTDALGFGSLMFAHVGPVHDFGVMTGLGALLVLLALVWVLPGLALAGKFDADPQQAWGEKHLGGELNRLMLWIEHHPRGVGLVLLVGTLGLASGVGKLEVETDFTHNFRAGSPIVEAYDYVETNLGGAGVWDVLVPAPQPLTPEFIEKVTRLEDRLRLEVVLPAENDRTAPGLTKVLSLADALAALPGDVNRLPSGTLRNLALAGKLETLRRSQPRFLPTLYAADPVHPGQYWLRIMLRARERQSAAAKQQLIGAVSRICHEEFPESEVTGFFVLLTNLIDSLISDQWTTFGVALAGVAVCLVIAFRSLRLALAALVPNVLPIFLVLGLMGHMGWRMNMGAAMIAAVSMGLSVDSSIHYIAAFQRARRAGGTVAGALAEVQQSVGRAMVFSTLALVVGFSVLCLSDFVPTIYFGFLVSLTMLGGLLGNLLVLPLLIRHLMPETAHGNAAGPGIVSASGTSS